MRGVVAVACAVVLVAGCSAQAEPPPAPTVDRAAVAAAEVAKLALAEPVTTAAGLTTVGAPEIGVQPLVTCPFPAAAPELTPELTPATAGRTQRYQWTAPDGVTFAYSLYSAVYDGITARDAVKQARGVSKCHPNQQDPTWLNRQTYREQSLPSTKPMIDDRYGYCARQSPVDYTETIDEYLADDAVVVWDCAAFFAKGPKLMRLSNVEHSGGNLRLDRPTVHTVGQAIVDALVAP